MATDCQKASKMAMTDRCVYLTFSRIFGILSVVKPPIVPYMNCGLRRYGMFPVPCYGRPYWEFQCIIRGRARANTLRKLALQAPPVLYIFPPGDPHGWIAPDGDLSEILVLHVDASVASRLPAWRNHGEADVLPLTEEDLLRLRTLYDWLHPHFVDLSAAGRDVLAAGVVLLWDLWQDLENRSPLRPGSGAVHAADRVEQALAFYRRAVARNPSVKDIATLSGLSTSQLRRAFAAAGQPPPAEMFRAIQLDLARRLLARPGGTVSEVAEELGFGSLSAFTRAFTRHFGKSPRKMRGREPGGRS